MLECFTYLCVLLVSGETTPKENERIHLLKNTINTIAGGNIGHWIIGAGAYNITEVVMQDLQGSIVLCQEEEVAILSAQVVEWWRKCKMACLL